VTPLGRADEDRLIRETFRRNARTFSLAAGLLPRRLRLPVATLYLYCRTVDEIADRRRGPQAGSTADALRELADARQALAEASAGRPPSDGPGAFLWRRLAEVDDTFRLDWSAMGELLDGAQWDLDGRPIANLDDLLAYSDLVAGSVGAMMLPLLIDDERLRRDLKQPARDLGVAMQVTNIMRDVGEDLRDLGRVYLPADALATHGLSAADLQTPPGPGYAALCEELMRVAEDLYERAEVGIPALPRGARTAVRTAGRMYREILNEVRASGYDNLARRAVVPLRRKLLAASGGYGSRKRRLLRRAPVMA
jgi:phytoene synthase